MRQAAKKSTEAHVISVKEVVLELNTQKNKYVWLVFHEETTGKKSQY